MQHINVHKGSRAGSGPAHKPQSLIIFRIGNQPPPDDEMPRAKGKVNYKADLLIQVVEEKLPAGAIGWQEVAALYQLRSGELALRDHEDVKRHWVEKCCNKYKKPTGTPGDPKRDMILRCQRIHQKILNRNAAAVMGADSGGDDGLDVSSESDEGESEEEEVGGNETGGEMEEQAEYRAGSRVPTPIEEIAADEGSGVCVVDAADVQLLLGGGTYSVEPVPPLIQQSATQQSATQLFFSSPPLQQPQQPFQPRQQPLPPYQLPTPPYQLPTTVTAATTTTTTTNPSTSSSTKKSKKKKSPEPSSSLLSEKTKNSLSEKRGSIVKSIDKLASSIASDEANSVASASNSAMMPMMMLMQMQQQQQQQQFYQ